MCVERKKEREKGNWIKKERKKRKKERKKRKKERKKEEQWLN